MKPFKETYNLRQEKKKEEEKRKKMNNRKKEGMKERKRTEEKRKKERKRKKEKEIGIKKEKKILKMTFSIAEKFEHVTFRYQTSKPRTRVYEYHCQWCHYL